ncbi:hypothetical protein ACGFYZ_30640 [Streptomyces sp. NPDC048330]|uniref:hypothetical protein n=1 Tax=Streptomyces sp. NPDC048330 TaxID=3365533 RepID=UPI00371582D0
MTQTTHAVLTSGVLARLVDIAAAARNPGAAPLEDELQRFARLMQDSHTVAWVMPLDAVASLLEALADAYGTERFAATPTVFLDRLARAAGDEHADAFLRTLAALLRDPGFGDVPGYDELPLSQWEALARFDLVNEFASQLPTGEYGSDPEAEACELVAMDHPDCHGRIADLAGQLQRVLYMFRSSTELDAAFAPVMPSVTAARLRLLLGAAHAHFAEQH